MSTINLFNEELVVDKYAALDAEKESLQQERRGDSFDSGLNNQDNPLDWSWEEHCFGESSPKITKSYDPETGETCARVWREGERESEDECSGGFCSGAGI